MAQKPVLRGEVGCVCVAREVSFERGGMGERGCARRLDGWVLYGTVGSFNFMVCGFAHGPCSLPIFKSAGGIDVSHSGFIPLLSSRGEGTSHGPCSASR